MEMALIHAGNNVIANHAGLEPYTAWLLRSFLQKQISPFLFQEEN